MCRDPCGLSEMGSQLLVEVSREEEMLMCFWVVLMQGDDVWAFWNWFLLGLGEEIMVMGLEMRAEERDGVVGCF